MPIYEYLCTDGHRVDVVQKFADEALTACEVCGKPAQRVLHAPAVHFKGKGFYATDYGKGKKGNNGDRAETGSTSDSGSKDGAAASSGGSDGNSKAESKSPESKDSGSKSSESKSSGGDGSSKKSPSPSSS